MYNVDDPVGELRQSPPDYVGKSMYLLTVLAQNVVQLDVVTELNHVEENRKHEAQCVQVEVEATVEVVRCTFGYHVCDGEGDSEDDE